MIRFHSDSFPARARTIFAAMLAIIFISASGIPAPAEDADTLAREANKELRAAQNIMFCGKNGQALEKLAVVSGLLEKNVNRDAP